MKSFQTKININGLFLLKEAIMVFLKMLVVNVVISTIVSYLGLTFLTGQAAISTLIIIVIIYLIFFILFMFEACYNYYIKLEKSAERQ